MTNDKHTLGLIIPAGGKGLRFGGKLPKQFAELSGIPIIIRTLLNFEDIGFDGPVVIPVTVHYRDYLEGILQKFSCKLNIIIADGGETRQESVFNALQTNEIKNTDYVFVHDAVRPFFSVSTYESVLKAALSFGGAVPAIQPKDTIKVVKANDIADYTPNRNLLRAIQTPQCFKTELLIKAYKQAIKEGYLGTDDASLFEYNDMKVKIVDGDESNFKITTQTDFILAGYLLNEKAR